MLRTKLMAEDMKDNKQSAEPVSASAEPVSSKYGGDIITDVLIILVPFSIIEDGGMHDVTMGRMPWHYSY